AGRPRRADGLPGVRHGCPRGAPPRGRRAARRRPRSGPPPPARPGSARLQESTYELCEFLVDVMRLKIDGRFPHKVGLHDSCHGLRELRLGSGSERRVPGFSKVRELLAGLRDIELVNPSRPDECCGFGGTFGVAGEALSCMMGKDRIADHERAGAEIITGTDMSCLMHLDGLLRRARKPLRVMHVAEILDEGVA